MAGYTVSTNPVGPNTGIDMAMYLANLAGQYSNAQGGQGYSPFGAPAPWANTGVMSYGSGSTSPYDVPTQYLNAYNEAKAANEQRYNSILGGYQDRLNTAMANQLGSQGDILSGYENRYQRGLDNLQGLGDQQKKDTSQAYDKLQAEQRQQLTSRGLTGSTILPTMQQGVERQRQDALNRVNEQLQRERLNYDASLSGDALSAQERQYGLTNNLYNQLSGDTLGFAERRSDTYPDFNQLASLGQAYGAGGGGGFSGVDFVSPQSLGYRLPGYGNQQPQFMPQMQQQQNPFANMNPLQQLQFMMLMRQMQGQVNADAANQAVAHANIIRPPLGMDFTPKGRPGGGIGPPLPPGTAIPPVSAPGGLPLPPSLDFSALGGGGGDADMAGIGGGVDPNLASMYGVPVVDTYQQVVHFLGRQPANQAEVEWALQQIQSGRAYA